MKKEMKQLQENILNLDEEIKELHGKIKCSKEDSGSMKDLNNDALKETLVAHKQFEMELHWDETDTVPDDIEE